jgi:CHAT domain-containing protein
LGNQQAEMIIRQFPELAELLETKPTDITQLQASIPAGTVIIHPVLLNGFEDFPNTIALFVLTKDSLSVQKISIDPEQFDTLLARTYAQLTNRFDSDYLSNLTAFYNLIIRPVEAQIQATNPKQISIIGTGKLRYLPFEALYDSKCKISSTSAPEYHELRHLNIINFGG